MEYFPLKHSVVRPGMVMEPRIEVCPEEAVARPTPVGEDILHCLDVLLMKLPGLLSRISESMVCSCLSTILKSPQRSGSLSVVYMDWISMLAVELTLRPSLPARLSLKAETHLPSLVQMEFDH